MRRDSGDSINHLNSPTKPPDTNKTQFAFWHGEKFIKDTNQKETTANDMPNKPLCHPITSNKITQGWWVGRRNEIVRCKTLVYARGKN